MLLVVVLLLDPLCLDLRSFDLADGPGLDSWGYQSCTETLHSFSARGIRNYTFSLDASGNEPCASIYSSSVQPDLKLLSRRFGGFELQTSGVTNVIWSNGLLDPWSGGSFKTAPATGPGQNLYLVMASGAHHLDLRGPDPADPIDVTEARAIEEATIRAWIEQYAATHP